MVSDENQSKSDEPTTEDQRGEGLTNDGGGEAPEEAIPGPRMGGRRPGAGRKRGPTEFQGSPVSGSGSMDAEGGGRRGWGGSSPPLTSIPEVLTGSPPSGTKPLLPSTPEVLTTPKRIPTPDQAVTILREVQEGRKDPKTLTSLERRGIVAILMEGVTNSKGEHRHHSRQQLASLLKVSVQTIAVDLKKLRQTAGDEVRSWSVSGAVGYLHGAAERAYAMAFESGDYSSMFSIRREFVRTLKELGVLGSEREGLRITVESLGANLEASAERISAAFDPLVSGERCKPRKMLDLTPDASIEEERSEPIEDPDLDLGDV